MKTRAKNVKSEDFWKNAADKADAFVKGEDVVSLFLKKIRDFYEDVVEV